MTGWTSRIWRGPHLGHAEWFWVWLTSGQYHKHGYGPDLATATANAASATAHCNGEAALIPNFVRRF